MLNDDLIFRSALLGAYDAAHKGPPGGARRLIEEAPGVDAVPVCLCKSCTHWTETGEGYGECELHEVADSDLSIIHAFQTDFDWFCADGERADAPTCGPDYFDLEADDE